MMTQELTRQQQRHLARIGAAAKASAKDPLQLGGKCPAHRMVAKLAREMAGETYDLWASRVDKFVEAFPSIEAYADEAWPMFTEMAVTTLAEMLATNAAETLKEQISEALILDAPLRAKRKATVPQFYLG